MPDDRSSRVVHIPDAQRCDGSLAFAVLRGSRCAPPHPHSHWESAVLSLLGSATSVASPKKLCSTALSANTWQPFSSKPKIGIPAASFPDSSAPSLSATCDEDSLRHGSASPIDNARRPFSHHLSTHAAFPFPNRLGLASAPSLRDRCASLWSLRRSPPAPVDDHGGQDRPENSQPPWHASPGPLPIPRPSAPSNLRFSRLEPSTRGRSNPIELVERSSPSSNTTNRSRLCQRAPTIGLSVDP